MNFELLNIIASWVGWMPVAILLLLAILLGVWFYKERINLSNERIEGLNEDLKRVEKDLEDCKNFTPDVVAERLIKRHKFAQEALSEIDEENKENKKEIEKLNQEIVNTKKEANNYLISLEQAKHILGDLDNPRYGQLNRIIIHDIFSYIKKQSFIYIPMVSRTDTVKIKSGNPYRLDVIHPGMFKEFLFIYDQNNNRIGKVKSPYTHAYDKDYHETLLRFLKLSEAHDFLDGHSLGHEVDISVVLNSSEFLATSPIDEDIFYIRVPMGEEISKYCIEDIETKLAEIKIY